MKIFADMVMLAWIPAMMLVFALLPARRAIITSFLVGFLFLPMETYKLAGLPDYTKWSAICVSAMLGAALFDSKRVFSFVPRLIDIPIVIFCLTPFVSSLLNDLGLWDAFSASLQNVIVWGFPYILGRQYFREPEALRELAIGVFIGGLVYIPFCLFEIRMSPQLHSLVYGTYYRWGGTRLGGWRPAVFMDSGLQLGMWMTASSLVGFCLWWTGSLKRLAGVSTTWLVGALLLTTVLCRSTGALALLLMGLGVVVATSMTKSRLALLCLIAIAPAYLALRTSGAWNAEQLVAMAAKVDADRAQSLEYRIDMENMLVNRALESPVFGWGGWTGWMVFDEWGKAVSVSDGLWVIQLGTHGLVGLVSCFAALLLPALLVARRFTGRQLSSAETAPALALAVMVTLFAIDCLPNAMISPVYLLSGGAVAGFAVARTRARNANVSEAASGEAKGRVAGSVLGRRPYPNSAV